MILEGFEIEHWSCIGRVVVDGLPPTGVIVLHGPNGTGKSSIIEALRACMMDNKSTSKSIGRGFPKNSSDKPRVSVTFRAEGTSWKITKRFNSRDSRLESRTAAGQWKLETADPSEAHDRARRLAGGSDSSLGLHQLLWLTQAEFHLPDPKKLDADVQSRLRGVLGVLQTPLDDRFLGRVKKEWSRWFSVRSKPGEKPKLKKDCPLDKQVAELVQKKEELDQLEAEFRRVERMSARSADLEITSLDLQRQLAAKTIARDLLQQEYEKSLNRLDAHRFAVACVADAEKRLEEARKMQRRRQEAELVLRGSRTSAEEADRDVEEKQRRLGTAEQRRRERRDEIQILEETRRNLQSNLNTVNDHRQWLVLKDQARAAGEKRRHAERVADELEERKRRGRERPAPEPSTLKTLEENRAKAARLRANLEAAAIGLTLVPDPGATVPRLVIDGAVSVDPGRPDGGTPLLRSIRRRAEIAIPGWGRFELIRGSDARSLDQIEADLCQLDRDFAGGVAPFGVAAADPAALDKLRSMAAERSARAPELKSKQEELDRLAPHGLDPLRQEVARLEKLQEAGDSEIALSSSRADLPADIAEIDRLAERLKEEIEATETTIDGHQREAKGLDIAIDGESESEAAGFKKGIAAGDDSTSAPGLRQQVSAAENRRTTLDTTVKVLRDELGRMPAAEQIDDALGVAKQAIAEARDELDAVKLTEGEETIRERRDLAEEGLRAIQAQLSAVEKEFHQIKGALTLSEGLHQKRAAAEARVEELTHRVERETLESEAYDRLYALFEECREKQFGTVMGPIHDRVLRWMRLLRIGGYQSIRFNDQFLPEALIDGDGATELSLGEESTGTIEQVALMVRLALGSSLSTPEEPVVAMLDDPLTHSDVVRLERMRAVLKAAAAGDSVSTPPAGPLQVVVFTCHPEWFVIDGARIIDLANPDVLAKRC